MKSTAIILEGNYDQFQMQLIYKLEAFNFLNN